MRVVDKTEEDEVPLVFGWQHGQAIFSCMDCEKQRIYGFGVPEQKQALIVCDKCHKHTWHGYIKIY